MTWAKLDDGITDHPAMLALPRGIRLLHLEGLVWCCRHLTDGAIPRHVLGKLTDEPDATDAAAALVDAGWWAETDDGWEIVDFLKHQPSAEDVEKGRELNRERQRRFRQHMKGDHSLCDPARCKILKGRNAVTNRATNSASNGPPSRPDPTPPDHKGGGEGLGGPAGGSPPATADRPGGNGQAAACATCGGIGHVRRRTIDEHDRPLELVDPCPDCSSSARSA